MRCSRQEYWSGLPYPSPGDLSGSGREPGSLHFKQILYHPSHKGSLGICLKWSEIAQSCPTLCDPVDYRPPASSVHGISQARILEWGAISFSRGSSWPRDRTWVSCIAGRLFNLWATREAPGICLSLRKSGSLQHILNPKCVVFDLHQIGCCFCLIGLSLHAFWYAELFGYVGPGTGGKGARHGI